MGEAIPLTHFVRLSRGILLRGTTLGQMRVEMIAPLLFASLMLVFANLRFHKRLD